MHRLCVEMLADDLTGQSVLDVGGYDGVYAKLCQEHGASPITVVDSQQWRSYGWPEFMPFPGIRYDNRDIVDFWEPHDVVLCFNMFYHVKDVFGTAEALRRLTRSRLYLYTQILLGSQEPVFRLWQPQDANYNDKCYWKPTETALIRLFHEVGFESVHVAGYGDDERIGLVCQ